MALVKLYGNLRQLAGKSSINVDGKTVMEILDNLRQEYPSLINAVLDGVELRSFNKIMVNGHDILLAQGFATAIRVEDIIAIFPPISGGACEKGKNEWL